MVDLLHRERELSLEIGKLRAERAKAEDELLATLGDEQRTRLKVDGIELIIRRVTRARRVRPVTAQDLDDLKLSDFIRRVPNFTAIQRAIVGGRPEVSQLLEDGHYVVVETTEIKHRDRQWPTAPFLAEGELATLLERYRAGERPSVLCADFGLTGPQLPAQIRRALALDLRETFTGEGDIIGDLDEDDDDDGGGGQSFEDWLSDSEDNERSREEGWHYGDDDEAEVQPIDQTWEPVEEVEPTGVDAPDEDDFREPK